jgi:hypothetical protein
LTVIRNPNCDSGVHGRDALATAIARKTRVFCRVAAVATVFTARFGTGFAY